MKLSLNWIKDFVDFPAGDYSIKDLAHLLTLRTCEVEGFDVEADAFKNMVVGRVIDVNPHPNADKLRVCSVDIGGKNVQIVCGGENVKPELLVAVTLPGSWVKWHGEGDLIELKETEIRGVASFGMIAAEEEIGLPVMTPQKGITIADIGYICKKLKLPTPTAGTPLAVCLNKNDIIFEVDNKSITHRPDLWGHYGMAREFAAFWSKKLKDLKYKNSYPENGESVKVEIAQQGIASRFSSVIIKGIKVGPSPKWMQERLKACGMRPINNIVDITNYVMLELGHPLHAFDRRVVQNDSFVIRFAQEGEVVETLDHKKRTMAATDALVTNGPTALGVAGIMGGLNSEITDDTNEIILEVACWNPVMVRKTSQRLNLRSDAAARFEKSLDPEYTGFAFQRAVQLILKICRGAILAGPATDVYPLRPELPTILLHTAKANSMIGTNLSDKEITSYLKGLQFGVQKESKGVLRVTVPSWRATKDISIEEDLVEEIARAHGYENLKPHNVSLPVKAPIVDPNRTAAQKVRSVMALALGFNESLTYSFYGERELEEFLFKGSPYETAHYNVANPLSNDQTHLRVSLIPNLLKAAVRNAVNNPTVKLFEIGNTYVKETGTFMPKEERYLAAVALTQTGDAFDEMLGALRIFLAEMKVPHAIIERSKDDFSPFKHHGACAYVKSGDRLLGSIFDINPLVLKNLDCPRDSKVAAFELNITRLVQIGEKPFVYQPLPRFPGIEIDISVLVDSTTEIGTVAHALSETDSNGLIHDVSFMHLFEDEAKLGAGKKSLTMRVVLQSSERTLTDEEMKTVQQALFAKVAEKGWSVR